MSLIESLLNLHRVDAQVRGLRSRLTSAERYLAAQNKQVNDLLGQQHELQVRRKHLQASIANQEMEIKGIDERIEKLRGELNSSATNKQYTALLHELNTVKAQRAAIEDKLLGDMEQLEKLHEQFTLLEGQVAERTKVRDLAQHQLDERTADVGQRLSELESERSAAAAVVPASALAIFDDLADTYDGEVMAAVEEIDRKHRDYSCAACNMTLPFDHISQLTSKREGSAEVLLRCPSCSRILHMQDEMRGTLAKK